MAARTTRRTIAGGALALLGTATLGLQAMGVSPVGAETLTYTASATSGSIVLNVGSANQQTITNPTVTFSGSLDDVSGDLVGTTAFQRSYTSSFAGPFGLTLYAGADLIAQTPVEGTYDPATGALTATAANRLSVTVYNQAGATQNPATDGKLTNQTGQSCIVDLALEFSGTFDEAAGTLSLADPSFTVPAFPAGCGVAQAELTNRLSGPNNTVSLNFAGQVAATTTTSTTTTTAPASTSSTTPPVVVTTVPATTAPVGETTTTSEVAVAPTSAVSGPSPTSPTSTGVQPSSGTLPRTGSDTTVPTAAGVTLLAVGAGILLASRRRRAAELG